jgi:hypothetical protein
VQEDGVSGQFIPQAAALLDKSSTRRQMLHRVRV